MSGPTQIVDTSIWIDHINGKDDRLVELLRQRRVLVHPMIIGEIALGSIRERGRVLNELRELPRAPMASHDAVVALIEDSSLYNCGIGFVDAHLVASALLKPNRLLWTRDKRLRQVAGRLSLTADLD